MRQKSLAPIRRRPIWFVYQFEVIAGDFMDDQGTKPVWNLTLWALAGFLLAAIALHIGGATPAPEIAASTSETPS